MQVSPVPLNEGEAKFVKDLRFVWETQRRLFEDHDLYLLRNLSRGKGLGIFMRDSSFYPDFILWLVKTKAPNEGLQRIAFVDPKGIRNLDGLEDDKIA